MFDRCVLSEDKKNLLFFVFCLNRTKACIRFRDYCEFNQKHFAGNPLKNFHFELFLRKDFSCYLSCCSFYAGDSLFPLKCCCF